MRSSAVSVVAFVAASAFAGARRPLPGCRLAAVLAGAFFTGGRRSSACSTGGRRSSAGEAELSGLSPLIGSDRSGLDCAASDCAPLGWAALGWAALGWAALGWAGRGRLGRDWAGVRLRAGGVASGGGAVASVGSAPVRDGALRCRPGCGALSLSLDGGWKVTAGAALAGRRPGRDTG